MVAKQVADLLTFTRGLLLVIFPWLAVTGGQESLSLAVMLLISNWTGDVFDGALARRSRKRYDSWIGDHDLEIDMAVALGLLIYTIATGYVQLTVGVIYILIWAMYFLRVGIPRTMGMLFQAPIYGWFIYVSLKTTPSAGLWLVVWLLAAVVLTWPRFPREVVPGFLSGVKTHFSSDEYHDR
ncbi:MAG: CDP-alcohol phosphatidyltransferase family protein [Anaerolineales bacterium]